MMPLLEIDNLQVGFDTEAGLLRAVDGVSMSVGQVAGQLLSFQLLGEEAVSLQPEIKLVKTLAGALAGQALRAAQVRQRTGCLVIAVERAGAVVVEFADDFVIAAADVVYVCGTPATIAAYFAAFPGSRP